MPNGEGKKKKKEGKNHTQQPSLEDKEWKERRKPKERYPDSTN